MTAAVVRFEATVAPHIAAEALPEAGLDGLRLQAPALRPVGCWWAGCAPPLPCVQHRGAAVPVGCLPSLQP
jgi:hypothetical protein